MSGHENLDGLDIHVPCTWEYADAAARTGAVGFVAADVGKLSWQQDDDSIWILTVVTPVWVQVGHGSGTIPLTDLGSYARGSIIRGGAADWEAYDAKTDGAALIGDGTDIISDLTPLWKGEHNFQAGVQMSGATTVNIIEIPDNVADAISLEDGGGLEYLRVVSTNANPYLLLFPAGGGNVGIGTTGPGAKLDVFDAGNTTLYLRDTTAYAQGVGGGLGFVGKYKADGTYFPFATIRGVKENATVDNASGKLIFSTYLHGSGGTLDDQMVITSSGDVGIGVTEPSKKLEVDAGTDNNMGRFITDYDNTAIAYDGSLVLYNEHNVINAKAGIQFNMQDGDGDQRVGAGVASVLTTVGTSGSSLGADLIFWTNEAGNANYAEKMRITDNGNVGIGVTLPLAQLHVDQTSETGAQPVLSLDQADISDGFINFIGASAASAAGPISTWTAGNAIQGFYRIEINGVQYWAPYYNDPTS